MFRQLSPRQWLYLPRLFSPKEQILLAALAAVALAAGGLLLIRLTLSLTSPAPAVGGTFREGTLSEPRFINPLFTSNDTDRDLANLVFSKIIRYDRNGNMVMDLAERIEVSDDGKSYTVFLRSGVRWHDGEAFSSSDVVFTIKAIQDPEYKSPLRPNWQGVAVEKVDEATIRFTLRQPYAPFMENLAVGILPEHLWRKIPRDSALLSDLNIKPVGTGPYRFKKLARREDGTITSVVLERYKGYHLDGPYVKEIRFSFYPAETDLITAYRRNNIDGLVLLSSVQSKELERLDVEFHPLRLPKIFAVFLNAATNPILGRISVRQALAAAIDREVIIENTVAGSGVEVNSALPPGSFGFAEDIPPIEYDPEAARKILADDGWKDADGDGIMEKSEGSGRQRTVKKLEILIVTSDAPELTPAAELIAQMWRAIGVRTEVKTMAISDLETAMIRPRAYEALIFGEVFGHDPDPFAFWHTSQLKDPGLNIALYSNPAVDRLLEEARRTTDSESRALNYREFQRIVSREIGAIFLYSPTYTYVTRKNIKGVNIGAVTRPEERFNEVNAWYIDTRRTLK